MAKQNSDWSGERRWRDVRLDELCGAILGRTLEMGQHLGSGLLFGSESGDAGAMGAELLSCGSPSPWYETSSKCNPSFCPHSLRFFNCYCSSAWKVYQDTLPLHSAGTALIPVTKSHLVVSQIQSVFS